ncbi:MAG: AAA family ATPase, partial [Chlorobiales bacterium]|nr:AAA family ATPase [Chlorobiales bacterium]
MKIAISGKGGVGKTTLCALLARELSEQGKRVLAIDADPNGNLAEAVGYDEETAGRIEPLIEKKNLVEERTGTKPGSMGGCFVLNPKVDDLVERFSVEINGLRLMVTGELKEAL